MEKMVGKKEEEEDIFYSPEKVEENDVEEKKKVCDLRGIVEKEEPACKEVDNSTLRRFLRARDLDVEKACAMLIKYLTWRRTFIPEGTVPESSVPKQIADNKAFMQGTDKRGCPILVLIGAKHFPSKQGTDEFKRFVVFVLDKVCSRIPNGQEKFTALADLKGYGYSNGDVRGYIAALSILQDYYPERLGKLLIVNAPYIFMTAWKIVYPFIDKKTKKKIIFVENKKLHDTLLEEIDEDQLPETYGGKMKLIPIQDC